MAEPARITSLYSGSISVQLTGELDVASVPALSQQLDSALEMSSDLVVDLQAVTFLDAAVIAAFLSAQHQALVRGGSVVLVGASPWVEKVLRASRATEAIPLLPLQRQVHGSRGQDDSLVSS